MLFTLDFLIIEKYTLPPCSPALSQTVKVVPQISVSAQGLAVNNFVCISTKKLLCTLHSPDTQDMLPCVLFTLNLWRCIIEKADAALFAIHPRMR